jgi:hypothetical protein
MANAISVHTTLESENIRIPELSPFIGKKVQIIVVEEEPATADSARDAENLAAPARVFGSLRGSLNVPEDFDEPLPEEILRAFEGEGSG